MMPSFRLDDRVIAVVGAATGIGRAVAQLAAQQGADVALVDVNRGGVQETAASVESFGTTSGVYIADVADVLQIASAFDNIVGDFGRVDALVYVAGIFEAVDYLDLREASLQRMLDVNLKGCHNCIRQVLPQMIERRGGKIVAVGSIAGKIGAPGASHYSASKAALMALIKSLAREFGSYGININAIAPGIVDTAIAIASGQARVERLVRGTVLGRMGRPEEVAGVAVFLCTDAASFVTGQIWNVCGGSLMD